LVRAGARQPLRDGTLSDEVRVAVTEGLGMAPATGPSPMGPEWGYFPSYTCAFGGKIIPLEMVCACHAKIWLSYRPGSGRTSRVQRMIDWPVEGLSAPQDSRGLPKNSSIHTNLNRL
jgi:DNA-binding transcriptional LysR family regulator